MISRWLKPWVRWVSSEEAATMVEYALLIAFIGVTALIGFTAFADQFNVLVNFISTNINNALS